ncbi:hypothetical protein RIF29_17840 [Crotalaria pallida]|uniref:Uncharacterized protein n=1 Tax=Crotalaria pallida TaxID=3830 RepID=A0AAN9FK52_CROPI
MSLRLRCHRILPSRTIDGVDHRVRDRSSEEEFRAEDDATEFSDDVEVGRDDRSEEAREPYEMPLSLPEEDGSDDGYDCKTEEKVVLMEAAREIMKKESYVVNFDATQSFNMKLNNNRDDLIRITNPTVFLSL